MQSSCVNLFSENLIVMCLTHRARAQVRQSVPEPSPTSPLQPSPSSSSSSVPSASWCGAAGMASASMASWDWPTWLPWRTCRTRRGTVSCCPPSVAVRESTSFPAPVLSRTWRTACSSWSTCPRRTSRRSPGLPELPAQAAPRMWSSCRRVLDQRQAAEMKKGWDRTTKQS